MNAFTRFRLSPYFGPLITLFTVVLSESVSRAIIQVPNPTAFYLIAITIASGFGGLRSGLISAALAIAFAALVWPEPGGLFVYTQSDIVRLSVLVVTAPGTAVIVGLLKRHNDRLVQDQITQAVAEARLAADYEREHRIAESLQKMVLSEVPRESIPEMDVATVHQPALDEALVGGDFYDVFPLDKDRLALVVGDASGKGLSAAARTVEVRYALRAFLREHYDPGKALAHVNDLLCATGRSDDPQCEGFTCVAVAIVDPKSGEVQVASAGMEPPLLMLPDGDTLAIRASGLPIGVHGTAPYVVESVLMPPGALLLMLTDGITEARRAGGDLLGYDGMIGLVQDAIGIQDAEKIGKAILAGAEEYAGRKLQDDACILIARRRTPYVADQPAPAAAHRGRESSGELVHGSLSP